jgi:holo-[acyl-carrier protein] synthase
MVGIDIIKTARMQKMMQRFGNKALERFLTQEEISLVKNYKTAAGFWATKEALSKALGTGIGSKCSFFDIRISKTPQGAPKLALSKKLIKEFKIQSATLSITHDGEYAISVVVLESSTTNKIEQF